MGRDRLIRHILLNASSEMIQPSQEHDQAASDMYIRRIIIAMDIFSAATYFMVGTPFLKAVNIIRPTTHPVNSQFSTLLCFLRYIHERSPKNPNQCTLQRPKPKRSP